MNVLISGGSGLIGREITKLLLEKGHQVAWLSRSTRSEIASVQIFQWDPDLDQIDSEALAFADAIINLAGSNIAQRWTPHFKNTIIRSRVDGTRLLYNSVRKSSKKLQAFISASATGYYPNHPDKVYRETDAPGNDFLSLVCQKWEQEAQLFEDLKIRTVRLRIGIVLDSQEGALAKIAEPIKWGVGAPLGNGKQWMPWIHRHDLARIFVYALENEKLSTGVYNAVGPESVQNKALSKKVAQVLNRPFWLPPIPAGLLKLILGEMATITLASTRCSSEKIQNSGFEYQFPELEAALKDLYPN
tara:strand:+ start:1058 stop:1963 length:906 start_codon:yes stop_codon:yes gene_type:complete